MKPRIRTCYTRFTKEEEVKFQRRLEEGYDLEGDMRYNLWKDMHLQEPSTRKELDHSSGACTDNTCILLSSPTSKELDCSSGVCANNARILLGSCSQDENNCSSQSEKNTSSVENITSSHCTEQSKTCCPPLESQFIAAPFPSFYYYNPPCYPPYPPVGNEWYNPYLSYVPPSNMIQRQTLLSKMLKNGPEIKIPDIPPKTSGKVLTSAENLKIIEEKEQRKKEEEIKKQERKEQGIVSV